MVARWLSWEGLAILVAITAVQKGRVVMPKVIVKRARPNSHRGAKNTGIRLEKNHQHNYQTKGKHMRCTIPRCKAHYLISKGVV